MTLRETAYVCNLIILYKNMKEQYDNSPNLPTAKYMSKLYTICIKDLEGLLTIEEDKNANW